MRIAHAIALGALALVGATGCHDYLSGPSLGANNPNSVQKLKDPTALYVGLEGAQAQQFTSQFARWMGEYSQQTAGVGRQQAGYDIYVVGPGDVDGAYSAFWAGLNEGGGGAGDARLIQQYAQSASDSLFKGIGMVWEAMLIGEAAEIWGAVPYSQAFNAAQFPTPKYDDQITALHEVETTLDSALIYLKCTPNDVNPSSTNIGPTGHVTSEVPRSAEVIYAGRTPSQLKAVYTSVAHTLKARFYLGLAPVEAAAYDSALIQAQQGIASTADDWNWYANAALNPNGWYAFQGARFGDLDPAAAIIHLMKARIAAGLDIDNGRFGFYFADANGNPCVLSGAGLTPDGGCTGSRPGGNTALPYGEGNSSFVLFNDAGSFYSPAVTYTETQLIIAEAALKTGNGGLAQTALNNARANEVYGADALDGLTNCSPECTFAPQTTVVPATLENIIEEKYIDLFATPEVFNDYKRTCLPWLAAAPASPSSAVTRANIPGRLPYGLTSINADPNTPTVGPTALNANQPSACPTLTYSSTPAAW
jgi:starch-binding outer membrane protein, SusD/RagB family